MVTPDKSWLPERMENFRTLKAMLRRQAWMAFVLEFQKELLLNYRRHLFPDFIIQAPSMPPEILTPSDVNRLAREEEEARKRLGLPEPAPAPGPGPEPPPSWDADALNFFTRASITDENQKGAINGLVLALKAAGIWAKLRALYPFVGGTAASHSENLKSVSYSIVWGGGMVHNANGVTGNGSDACGHIGFDIMDSNYGSIAYGIYNRTSAADAAIDIQTVSPPDYGIYTRWANDDFYGMSGTTGGGGQGVALTNPDARGFYVVSRQSVSLYRAFKNGLQFGTDKTNAPEPLVSRTFLLLGKGSGGSLHNLALAFISDGLADADAAAFNSAVVTFQTALGRNV
jgi:hypothetical protein